ncbi:hypothetical protein FF38_13925 [Lucilia cuprina]|uniref:Transmembrane protein n=1 Tax=Lucilia cuprina TaxID=7375 RepID=A0A0L0BPX3_LUCCU|nr:hypothetical protein FF38_13925 [Lucilia cuprina]
METHVFAPLFLTDTGVDAVDEVVASICRTSLVESNVDVSLMMGFLLELVIMDVVGIAAFVVAVVVVVVICLAACLAKGKRCLLLLPLLALAICIVVLAVVVVVVAAVADVAVATAEDELLLLLVAAAANTTPNISRTIFSKLKQNQLERSAFKWLVTIIAKLWSLRSTLKLLSSIALITSVKHIGILVIDRLLVKHQS